MSQVLLNKPLDTGDGYVLMNTEMLLDMLGQGCTVTLPPVVLDGESMVVYEDEIDGIPFGEGVEIASVELVGEEEVQCIEVDDPEHLYLTDGFIPTHNTSNIVFLKSTDDSMLDTLQKMSGTTHRTYTDSKTITRDMEKLWMKNEGKASFTMTTREEPVIKYNDMAFISERNSIIFRAGDSPIWNRNETILPMSWRLFQNTIVHPGHEYSLQTIPTLSSAKDFDVRKNQPDFDKMLNKRVAQAIAAKDACTVYQDVYGYTDYQISQLDPDDYANEIMTIINTSMRESVEEDVDIPDDLSPDEVAEALLDGDIENIAAQAEENVEQQQATAEAQTTYVAATTARFAGGMLSPSDLWSIAGQPVHSLDKTILQVYNDIKGDMWNDMNTFRVVNGNLCGVDGTVFIRSRAESSSLATINEAAREGDTNVFAEGEIDEKELNSFGTYEVTDAFLRFLSQQPSWRFADGKFERGMARAMRDV